MPNFWTNLNKPFTILAPMEDVTDFVFREIVATSLPRPDVFFTEFTNADGLNSKGREKLMQKLRFSQNQRPIVAQIWGTNPENIRKAAELVKNLGFDGVDLNMGCPVPKVVKRGAGSGHINNMPLAKEIIDAARDGAKGLPLSVKTRVGFKKIQTDEWVGFLLSLKLDALTVHGRIASEMSKFPANWDEISNSVKLRDEISPETIIIGNGDLRDYEDIYEKNIQYKVDGGMIARGIFHNPWTFEKKQKDHSKDEYLSVLLAHLSLHKRVLGESGRYDTLKKFFKMYIKDFENAHELRNELMRTASVDEALVVLARS